MTEFSQTSRYRRAPVFVDIGLLRPGRRTIFLGAYPRATYQQRRDNQLFHMRTNDSFAHVATHFLGDPALWWILADYQSEDDLPVMAPLEEPAVPRILKIPSTTTVRSTFGGT